MKKHYFIFLFIFMASFAYSSELLINLAEYKPGGTYKLNLSGNVIEKIILNNVFSEYYDYYTLEIEKKLIEPEPFNPPVGGEGSRQICENLKKAINEYKKTRDTENEWVEKLIVPRLQVLIDEIKVCNDDALKNQASIIIGKRKIEYDKKLDKLEIGPGEVAVLKIQRPNKTWNFEIEKPKGKWLVSYGPIGIIPIIFSGDSYHLENTDNANEYIIKKGTKNNNYLKELVPGVFFYWMPYSNRTFNFGLSGGISYQFNAQNLAVFVGGSLIYNYNLCLNFGLGVSKLQYLKDKYKENMVIKENLDADQLYDTVYRPNPYISISFRFGSNPYKQEKKQSEEDNK